MFLTFHIPRARTQSGALRGLARIFREGRAVEFITLSPDEECRMKNAETKCDPPLPPADSSFSIHPSSFQKNPFLRRQPPAS